MYLPLGCFLDPASCLLITLPILYPIIVTHLGFNPVWFGILVTKMIEIGLLTPPVGLNVFTIAGVAPEIPVEEVFRGAGVFIIFESVTIVHAPRLPHPDHVAPIPHDVIAGGRAAQRMRGTG